MGILIRSTRCRAACVVAVWIFSPDVSMAPLRSGVQHWLHAGYTPRLHVMRARHLRTSRAGNQLTVPSGHFFAVDTIELRSHMQMLNEPFTNPSIVKVRL